MDKLERDYIEKNLSNLIEDTDCNESFLAHFKENGLFTNEDVQRIKAKRTDASKSEKFYDIIVKRENGFKLLLDALQKTKQTGARSVLVKYKADKLLPETKPSIETTQNKISRLFRFNVRAPAPLFTGRDKERQEMHEKLSKTNDNDRDKSYQNVNIISVCGLGGIGKTELVRQYVMEQYSEFYEYVIWVNAEPESIKESFRSVAKDKLNITTKDADHGERNIRVIVEEVYYNFADKKSLFIFDNAENTDYLTDFLPFDHTKRDSLGYLNAIITSRDSEWSSYPRIKVMHVKEMEKKDAIEFARKGLEATSEEDIKDIEEIVEALQCFPLAIQQAIAYINEEKQNDYYTIHAFMEEYRKQALEILTFSPTTPLSRSDYTETTYTTWKMTLEKIESHELYGNHAVSIINCMAYMADTFERSTFYSLSMDEKSIARAVRLLRKYSMVNGDLKQNSKLRIHRLVQEVVRIGLCLENKEESVIESALQLLALLGKLLNGNLDHAISVWGYASKYPNLRFNYRKFPSFVVEGLIGHERYSEALKFGQDKMSNLIEQLGVNHPDVLEIHHQIGVAQYRLGNYKEAMDIFELVLEKRKQVCGEMNPGTLDTIHFIANFKLEHGEFEVAREMFREVFEKKKEVLGLENEKTIDSLHNEGICNLEMNQYEAALKCYNMAYEMYEKISGPESDAALTALQNIAVVYGDMGKVKLSIKSFRKLQDAADLRKDTRRKLTTDQNLAFYLLLDGQHKEALELCQETLSKLAAIDAEDHPGSLITKSNLGIIFRKLDKLEQAIATQNEVYIKLVNRFGKDSDKTLLVKAEIAILWGLQHHFDESQNTLEDVIKTLEGRRGSKNHNVLRLKLELAIILKSQDKFDEALELLQNLKDTIESAFESDHVDLPKINECIERIKEKSQEGNETVKKRKIDHDHNNQ